MAPRVGHIPTITYYNLHDLDVEPKEKLSTLTSDLLPERVEEVGIRLSESGVGESGTRMIIPFFAALAYLPSRV